MKVEEAIASDQAVKQIETASIDEKQHTNSNNVSTLPTIQLNQNDWGSQYHGFGPHEERRNLWILGDRERTFV